MSAHSGRFGTGKEHPDCRTGNSSNRSVDPEIIVKPTEGQIDDLISEINLRVAKGNRVLVTTLTKKMAEDLTSYLEGMGIRVRYMHHDIDTVERMEIIRDLRLGEYDVLVGINCCAKGLTFRRCRL